jgi:hypothetical protein
VKNLFCGTDKEGGGSVVQHRENRLAESGCATECTGCRTKHVQLALQGSTAAAV